MEIFFMVNINMLTIPSKQILKYFGKIRKYLFTILKFRKSFTFLHIQMHFIYTTKKLYCKLNTYLLKLGISNIKRKVSLCIPFLPYKIFEWLFNNLCYFLICI